MKIAIIGSGRDNKISQEIADKAKAIGKYIANKGHIVVTGGCTGYPYAAVKGALENQGKTIAISPAKDLNEHINKYNFPTDNTETVYTGLGLMNRNKEVVLNADAVIVIGGEIGTLNEFTFAIYTKKVIGVLLDSGGIASLIEQIMKLSTAYQDRKIIYESEPEKLVEGIINSIN